MRPSENCGDPRVRTWKIMVLPSLGQPDVPLEDQWELFTTLCHILHEQKRFEELERMIFSALGSKEFMRDKERAREMEFMCLLACIYNDSSYFAYNIMRELVIKNPESNRNKDEAEAMLNNKKLSNKYEAIRELRRSKSENLEDNGPAFTGPA
ncbi:hypothetical protein Pcinc_011099 [Petrolisthes cinctipes]|uniref:Uncharacterized protein n=1 Tax=Petrolisthes cinctipes TaxID=88211 RepID=A0AAE1G1H2_PETCI|nr:hypothetical protein Pcinc_011099 [Petrolisthes cinctipes]